jgi:predicted kinase
MAAHLPLLVLVHGPPAAGKTTIAEQLARDLGLPLFAKDEIKEELFESLGADDPDESRRLGAAVYPLLFLIARRELEARRSIVLEANFIAGASEAAFARLPPHGLLQVHCSAPEETLMERYVAREGRHPGHHDAVRAEEVRAAIRVGRHSPLALDGTLIELDTSSPVDVTQVAAAIGKRRS